MRGRPRRDTLAFYMGRVSSLATCSKKKQLGARLDMCRMPWHGLRHGLFGRLSLPAGTRVLSRFVRELVLGHALAAAPKALS
jgi:hypothetical protein